MSCRESPAAAPPSNGREGKKKKGSAPAPAAPLLEVVLHDTIIFPEGGGQPSDVGILTSSDGELWDVIESKRHGGHAVHYVRLKPEQKATTFPISNSDVLRRGCNTLISFPSTFPLHDAS